MLRARRSFSAGSALRLLAASWLLATVPEARGEPPPVRRLPDALSCSAREELAFAETVSNEFFSQLQQSVAALVGGGFAEVWTDGEYGARRVRMQWLDPSGRPLLPPDGLVISGPPDTIDNPVVVAGSAAGEAYVAFVAGSHVVVQRFVSAQSQWPGTGIVAVDNINESAAEPNLVANPGGGVFACFHFWAVGPVLDIRCQRFDAAGARLWTSSGVSIGSPNAELRVLPRGVSDGAGGILLFWRNQRNFNLASPGPMLMEGQRFAADGSRPWGAAPKVVRTTNLASDNGYSYDFHQVVPDGSGGAVLAFNDWTGTSDLALDVLAQRVSGAGDLLWGSGAVVTGANGHQQHDQTIATGDGGAIVAVEDYDPLDSNRNRLLLFRLGPNGTHAWSSSGVLVSDLGSTALDYGAFGSFNGGVLRLAWTHQTAQFTFEMDVPLATFSAAGTRTGTTLMTTAPDGQFLRGLAFSPDTGGVLAVWDDRRKGSWSDMDVGGALFVESSPCRSGSFFTLTPCRLLDTRGPLSSSLLSGEARNLAVSGACGIPASAMAVALNVTAVSPEGDGYLTLFPAIHFRPLASMINTRPGLTRANNAILRLPLGGSITIFPFLAGGRSTHLVIDVNGYFE